MKTPDNFQFSPEHLWVHVLDANRAQIGITDYAQDMLGDIVYVDLPAIGSPLNVGEPFGLVESVKTGSDLIAPLAGTVVQSNAAIASKPELLNEAPYDTWLLEVQLTDANHALLNAEQYQSLIKA